MSIVPEDESLGAGSEDTVEDELKADFVVVLEAMDVVEVASCLG